MGRTNLEFSRRWGAVIALAILLGVMAVASYRTAQQSFLDVMYLAQEDLPLFDRIQELRARLAAQEAILYAYYVTADREAYRQQSRPQAAAVDSLLKDIGGSVPDAPMMERIRSDVKNIREISAAFDQVMSADRIDWDEARRVLAEFSPLSVRIDSHSGALTAWVRKHIESRSMQSLERIRLTLAVVTGLASLAVIAAAVLWLVNTRRLMALREQKRLSSFPQRNPFPVLGLTSVGELCYANAAAHDLAERILGRSDPATLLPRDLSARLERAKSAVQESEYRAGERDIHLVLHWLDDFQEYHAYLADITDSKQAERQLRQMAFYDALTALPNRANFNQRFSARGAAGTPVLALLDIDRFEQVATTVGHGFADRVLRECARRLQNALNPPVGLSGGELYRFEATLFCAVISAPDDPLAVLERMRCAIEPVLDLEGREFFLTVSIGVVPETFGADVSIEELLREADSAMRAVKSAGGNGVRRYDAALDSAQLARVAIENGLQHALERAQLRLLYQPKLSLSDGRIVGSEALLRWRQNDGKEVPPSKFIPIAEETGLILPIGEWVLNEACRSVAECRFAGTRELQIAVNISARQLVHGNLVELVETVLRRYALEPGNLELEITESAALSDYRAAGRVLARLRALGVCLSLDDFGTGFSSLEYLQDLPVDKLKVDQTFVRNMIDNRGAAAIVHSIITLVRGLGLTVVAEGVETERQLQQLREWGCHEIQGFLLGVPMPAADFPEFLRRHDAALWSEAIPCATG